MSQCLHLTLRFPWRSNPWWTPNPSAHPSTDLTRSLQFMVFICIYITNFQAALMNPISLILSAHPGLRTGFSLLFTEELISIPQGDRKPPQPTTVEAVQRQPPWQATDSDGRKSEHFSPERTSSHGKSQRCSCHWEVCSKTAWRQRAKSDSVV